MFLVTTSTLKLGSAHDSSMVDVEETGIISVLWPIAKQSVGVVEIVVS